MTDTVQDSSASARKTPRASATSVQQLLDSLVGITSARAALGDDGEVEEIHVLADPDSPTEWVAQSVASALRARFDLTVPRDRIFVARVEQGATRGDPDVTPQPLASSRARVETDLGPPPWPERPASEPEPPEEDGRTVSSSSRRSSGGTSGGLESRLLFLGHRTAKRRSRAVEVAVDLQWRGFRYRGVASVPDRTGDRLQAPALATLRALDDALGQRTPGDRPREVALTLRGVELVDALGGRHVMVGVEAEVDGTTTPLTGTLVVDDSVELATILATLQATDRRVRAILLNHLPRNGGPPPRS